ncbi:MAG: hypothetical protein IJG42_09290 [Muribaculaceae bacterium]|nr:hypothetical protein [Muribaculaceae bacterium]
MNMSIEKMLSHVYEIEGLMLVTRRLGEENTPDVITDKIKRKVKELAEMCGVTLDVAEAPAATEQSAAPEAPAPAEPSEISEISEPSESSEPTEQPAPQEHLPEDDYDADETWQHENGEEFKEVFTLDYEEPRHVPVEPDKVPVEDREPDDDITVEFIEAPDEEPVAAEPVAPFAPVAAPVTPEPPVTVQPPIFRPPVDTSDEPVPEPDPALLPEADDEPDITVEFIEAPDAAVPEPDEEMPQPPVPTEFPEPVEPLRVEQKLQRHLSKDIRKAFSLNDRFRFQRELFAGSASAMNTAIEHIEVMTSYGNAELYFFSQLHWDRDNQDVQDFMEIVRNHFQS